MVAHAPNRQGATPSRQGAAEGSTEDGERMHASTRPEREAGPGDGASGPAVNREERFRRQIMPEMEILYRVAYSRTGNPHDAEDLVQETLLAAYRGLDTFDGRHPRAWLVTILKNRQRSGWRRRRLSVVPEADALPHVPDQDPEPEAVVVGSAHTSEVMAAFEALRPEHRRVIELVDVGGLSYQEAAEALGIPVGTVTSRLHHARREIRRRVEDRSERRSRPTGPHPPPPRRRAWPRRPTRPSPSR